MAVADLIELHKFWRRLAEFKGALRDFTPSIPFEWTDELIADHAQAVKMAAGKPVLCRKNEQGIVEFWSEDFIYFNKRTAYAPPPVNPWAAIIDGLEPPSPTP